MEYLRRSMERKFLRMSEFFKVVLLTGARQTGKTTMLRHLAQGTGRVYVSLDDMAARSLAQTDPVVFFQRYQPPLIIDEVQYAPQLFPYIKMLVDSKTEAGQIWLTGSQHYYALRDVQESLAGRIGLLRMQSLSQRELMGDPDSSAPDFSLAGLLNRQKGVKASTSSEVFARIWRGGMPGAQSADEEMRLLFFNSYIESYLMRDVAELGKVQELERYRTFLKAAAALTGQQVNYATISEAAGISQPTAKSWLELLQSLGIVWLLRPYANNALKRLARTPKLYFEDTGLASFLTGWPTSETLEKGPASGAFFENFVVMELARRYACSPKSAEFSYFRDSNKKEIDLLVEIDRILHPLEIKQSGSPDIRETRKFETLDRIGVERGSGGIVCLRQDVLPIDQKNNLIPAGIL